jgi:ABC-type branched-subunit amino acid transport system substrate-binding protein
MRARARLIAVLAVVTLVALACSNASSDKSSGTTTTTAAASGGGGGSTVDQPGVTKDTIRVGGVASVTNALNGPYKSSFDGVKAYFDMVNSAGGIYGRKLELVSERDDQMGQNQEQVKALLAQDNVFAVAPIATIFSFSGAQALVDGNVPTFGWNINDEYTGHPNLFGSNSGALCNGCVAAYAPFLAKELHKKKIGVLAYNVSNSAQCADGYSKSFARYPSAKVVFLSKSLSFGTTDFSVEVGQMKDKGVDMVMTCMDTTATLNLAKELRKQDLKAIQYLPNGYDAKLVSANGEFFDGDYAGVSFAPFETRPKPVGLAEFDKWMDKKGYAKNEEAMQGWISAFQLHLGLKAAGASFTRQKVIDALNKMTAVTADGLIPPRNWTKEHNITHNVVCTAWVKVVNGKFVPVFTQPGKPFQCNPDQPAKLPTTATYK